MRNMSITCCLVSCTAITGLSLLCEIAVPHTIQRPGQAAWAAGIDAEADPLTEQPGAAGLAAIEMGTMMW